MINCNMIEMRYRGFYYIWFNGYVSSRIDRVFCNILWDIQNIMIIVEFVENGLFNYILIFLEFNI